MMINKIHVLEEDFTVKDRSILFITKKVDGWLGYSW
jgi:hypothetical protein